MSLKIEEAQESDLHKIVEIYNWAIANTTATFDTEVKSFESQLPWFHAHDSNHPILVARDNNELVGWGAISKWSDRQAYFGTGEVSLYIHPDFHSKGIGHSILENLLSIARKNNFRTLVSKIAGKSDVSIHLHKKLGFLDIGTMQRAGKKFGEVIDVHLMQILL